MLEESIYNTKYHMLYFCNMFVFFCLFVDLVGLDMFVLGVWLFCLDWFSIKKMFEPKKPSLVWIGSVFTVFQKRNRTKLIGLDWFGWSVYLKIQLKKNHILTKYFIELCIIVFHILFFSCSLFFKQLFITNLSQYFIHMIQDSFIHHSSKTTSSNSNISIIHDPYMHHSSINTKIPKRTS